MEWRVEYHPRFLSELAKLPEAVQDEIAALAEALEQIGPQMKRPRSDTLNGSKHANMKELRFDAEDGVWRVAYAFGPPAGGRRQVWNIAEPVLQGLDQARRRAL
jgi:hypothetical protein